MKSLCICSTHSFSGKSAIILGIALKLQEEGTDVGYFKPIGNLPALNNENQYDEDAYCMRTALIKKDSLIDMSPVLITPNLIDSAISGSNVDIRKKVFDSLHKITSNHDFTLIEGGSTLFQGKTIGLSTVDFVAQANMPALLVVKDGRSSAIDEVLHAKTMLNGNLLGVVFTSVPENKVDFYKDNVVNFLNKNGIRCFGVLPLDKVLSSITVEQISETLNGTIITAPEYSSNLVETFLVGAMGQERALRFFRKKVNKAVITGGDRADLQMAALETPTRCIILTGNLMPSSTVMGRAEQLNVPMVLVKDDTWTTVQRVEKLTGRLTMDKPIQVKRMRLLLDENFNFDLLLKELKDDV